MFSFFKASVGSAEQDLLEHHDDEDEPAPAPVDATVVTEPVASAPPETSEHVPAVAPATLSEAGSNNPPEASREDQAQSVNTSCSPDERTAAVAELRAAFEEEKCNAHILMAQLETFKEVEAEASTEAVGLETAEALKAEAPPEASVLEATEIIKPEASPEAAVLQPLEGVEAEASPEAAVLEPTEGVKAQAHPEIAVFESTEAVKAEAPREAAVQEATEAIKAETPPMAAALEAKEAVKVESPQETAVLEAKESIEAEIPPELAEGSLQEMPPSAVDSMPEASPEIACDAPREAIVEAEAPEESSDIAELAPQKAEETALETENQQAFETSEKVVAELPPEISTADATGVARGTTPYSVVDAAGETAEVAAQVAEEESPVKFAGEAWEASFADEVPGPPNDPPMEKAEIWMANAEEARPDVPRMFWQASPATPATSSRQAPSDSWADEIDDSQFTSAPPPPAATATVPTLPVPQRDGVTASSPVASSGGGTPSVFRLLPPPPAPSCSVGSSSPLANQVVMIEQLKDETAPAPAPVAAVKASGSTANPEVVAAAALALGHPTKGLPLGMEPKVKAFKGRENSDEVGGAGSDEETAIIAGAADAEVDDDACELLLGSDVGGLAPQELLPPPRGHFADGLDSESDDEQANRGPWAKALPAGASKAPEPVGTSKAAMELPQALSAAVAQLAAKSTAVVPIDGKSIEPKVSSLKSLSDIDLMVTRRLDKFFSDDAMWNQIVDELASTRQIRTMDWLQVAAPAVVRQKFRVEVPEPYPGIQYRRSKQLGDRYPKYAKHGITVTGHIEDGGEWLKVGENVYLPTKVGAIEILKPVFEEGAPSSVATVPLVSAPGRSPLGAAAPTIAGSMASPQNKEAQAVMNMSQVNVGTLPDPEADGCVEGGRGDPRTNVVVRMTALRHPQELTEGPLITRPLSNLDEASRLLSGVDPINPFTDTPRGGSPSESPLRSRLPSDSMVPINPFSDTPPGGSPSVTPLRSRPPASI